MYTTAVSFKLEFDLVTWKYCFVFDEMEILVYIPLLLYLDRIMFLFFYLCV